MLHRAVGFATLFVLLGLLALQAPAGGDKDKNAQRQKKTVLHNKSYSIWETAMARTLRFGG